MTKIHRLITSLVIAGCCMAYTGIAYAAQHLGTFGAWESFTEREGKNLMCYMASQATKSRGNYKKRDQTYIMVTHRPAEKSINVISVEAGYTYKTGSEVDLIIGSQTFKLFTSGGTAFAYDSKSDAAIVKAMIRGASMTIKGISSRGTQTTDTYSLKGFSASHKAIGAACTV